MALEPLDPPTNYCFNHQKWCLNGICMYVCMYVMLCYVMLCYVMLCYVCMYVMLCYVMLCYVMYVCMYGNVM